MIRRLSSYPSSGYDHAIVNEGGVSHEVPNSGSVARDHQPFVVADHGSANISRYTRSNIEIQGLDLWLSGIGRPTGNARTERVIGTLKAEEIKLQPMYANEDEARTRIDAVIADYNYCRPNAGVSGFAPAVIHLLGRAAMMARRTHDRRVTRNIRRKYWAGKQPCPKTGVLS